MFYFCYVYSKVIQSHTKDNYDEEFEKKKFYNVNQLAWKSFICLLQFLLLSPRKESKSIKNEIQSLLVLISW